MPAFATSQNVQSDTDQSTQDEFNVDDNPVSEVQDFKSESSDSDSTDGTGNSGSENETDESNTLNNVEKDPSDTEQLQPPQQQPLREEGKTFFSQDESARDSPLIPAEQSTKPSTFDTQVHPQSPINKDHSSNIDPGTNTIPADERGSKGEKCVLFVSCIEAPILDPGSSKPLELRDDEICRNNIDDNGNGRVDEEPYCTVVPGESSAPKKDTVLKGENSTGPSPFGP